MRLDPDHCLEAHPERMEAFGQNARGMAGGCDRARRTALPVIVHADGLDHIAPRQQPVEVLVAPRPKMDPASSPCRFEDLEIYFGTLGFFNGL
jgi:hypothetical protein